MAYTKPDQTPFAANLLPDETVVTLDTGDNIAVSIMMSVEPHTNNPAVVSRARAVAADGSERVDANGQPIQTEFSDNRPQSMIDDLGGISAWQKLALLAVLGEDITPLFVGGDGANHADEIAHWSIRTNLASAQHSGPVANVGALL